MYGSTPPPPPPGMQLPAQSYMYKKNMEQFKHQLLDHS